MKKLIFGCTLMLCGMIGSMGWIIACTNLVQPGAWSSITNLFHGLDGFIAIAFFAIAVVGTVIAIRALKDKDQI